MTYEEIVSAARKKGLLLEKEIFDFLGSFQSAAAVEDFLEQIQRLSGQKIITKNVLSKNVEYVRSFLQRLPEENKEIIDSVFVKLGLSVEVRRENIIRENVTQREEKNSLKYKIFYSDTIPDKKLEVKDFVGYFRSRFQQIQRILMAGYPWPRAI